MCRSKAEGGRRCQCSGNYSAAAARVRKRRQRARQRAAEAASTPAHTSAISSTGLLSTTASGGTGVASAGQPADAPPLPRSLPDRIEAAVHELAYRPGSWVSLSRLRPALPDVPRDELDQAIIDLIGRADFFLIPEANQKVLSDADRAAGIFVGGERKDLVSFDKPAPDPELAPGRDVYPQDWTMPL